MMTTPRTPPETHRTDEAFDRFVRHRDPRDLAEVFDRTAPRLILVAHHLVRDAAAAEDLVQTTFLEALRSVDRYRPGRPVMPWLLAIMTRRAIDELRRRRLEAAGDALGDVPAPDADPLARLTRQETLDRVAVAIETLQGAPREVIALRLLHGLTPAEIARALDRPIGTVHVQLHRGAEKLRRILPRALGLGLTLALGTGRGLAAVRNRVLAAAAAPATVLATLLTPKVLLLVAGLLAVSLTAFAWQMQGPRPKIGRDTPRAPLSAGAAASAGIEDTPVAAPPASERSALSDGAIPADTLRIRGRLVAAESGLPIAGARIPIDLYAAGRRGPIELDDPAELVTGVDGLYGCDVPLAETFAGVLPSHATSVWVNASILAPGRVRTGFGYDLGTVRGGTVLDHGDVPLVLGIETRIRVVDEEGVGIGNAEVWLRHEGLDPRGYELRPQLAIHGFTDRDGVLTPELMAPGAWNVSNDFRLGMEFLGPDWLEVAAGHVPVELTIRYRRPDLDGSISGVAVDLAGRPLAGIELGAADPASRTSGAPVVRTDHDGRFAFKPVNLWLLAHQLVTEPYGSAELEVLEPRNPVPVGTRDLRVVLRERPRVRLRIEVVDAEGAPVQRFRYALLPVVRDPQRMEVSNRHGMNAYELELEGMHPGGVVERTADFAGDYELMVEAEGYATVFTQRVFLREGGTHTTRVVLERPTRWPVRVVDGGGRPVAGVRVELLEGIWRERPRIPAGFDFSHAALWGLCHATAQAVTDPHGLAWLATAAEIAPAAVRVVQGDQELALVEIAHVATEERPHQIVVPGTGAIEGRFVPLEALHSWGPTVEQWATVGHSTEPREELAFFLPKVAAVEISASSEPRKLEPVLIEEDGSFRFRPVPAGSWKLVVQITPRTGGLVQRLPAGEVLALAAGETRNVVLDVRALQASRLRGRALLDGAPAAHLPLRFVTTTTAWGQIVDGTGRIDGRVAPGRYFPVLVVDDGYVFRRVPIDLQPGQILEQELRFDRRRLALRIVDPGGDPLADRAVTLQGRLRGVDPNWLFVDAGVTDAEGRLVVDPALPFPMDVFVWDENLTRVEAIALRTAEDYRRSQQLGPVQIDAGQPESDVEIHAVRR